MDSPVSRRNCHVSASKSECSLLSLDGCLPSSGSDCQQGTCVIMAPVLPSRSANTHGSECAASSWSESCPVQAVAVPHSVEGKPMCRSNAACETWQPPPDTPCRRHWSSNMVSESEPVDCPKDDDATRRLQLLQVEGKYESWGPLLGGVLPSVGPSLLWGQICFDVTTEEQRGCWLLPEELLALQREAAPEEQQERQLFMNTPVSEKEQQAIDQVMLQMLETQQQNQVIDETQEEAETSLQGVQPAWLEQLILRYLHSCSFDRQKTFELLQSTLAFRTEHLPVLESEVYAELRNAGACYWHGRDRKMRPLLIVSLQRLQQLQKDTGNEEKVTRLVVFCLEYFLRYLCVAGAVESWSILCDLNGTSLSSFPMALLLKLMQLIQGAYRGRLYRFYILYAPRLFHFVAKPLVASLPTSTAKKVRVYTQLDDWHQERLAQFAAHQLEKKFGGTAPDITENWYPFRFFPGPFEPRDSLNSSNGDNGGVRWGSERALHTKVHALVHTGVSLHTSILQKRMAKTKPDTIENSDADRVETMCFRYAAWLHALPEVSLSPSIQDWARDVLRHHLNAHHEHLIQHLRESRHDQRAETQGISDGEPSKVPTTAAVGLSPSNTSPSGDASRTPSPLGESSAGSSAAPTRAVCLPAGASDSLSHHSAQQQNVEPHNHWKDLDVDIVVVASEETAGRITACDTLEHRVTKPPLHALSSSVSDEDAAAPSSVSRSTSAHHTCTARQASPVSLNPTSTIVAVSQPMRSVASISELRKASWESSLSETARPASDVETQSRANTFPGCRGASVGDTQHAGSARAAVSPRHSPQPGQTNSTHNKEGSSRSSISSACQQSNDGSHEAHKWNGEPRLPHGGWRVSSQRRPDDRRHSLESPVQQQHPQQESVQFSSRSSSRGGTLLGSVLSPSAHFRAYWALERALVPTPPSASEGPRVEGARVGSLPSRAPSNSSSGTIGPRNLHKIFSLGETRVYGCCSASDIESGPSSSASSRNFAAGQSEYMRAPLQPGESLPLQHPQSPLSKGLGCPCRTLSLSAHGVSEGVMGSPVATAWQNAPDCEHSLSFYSSGYQSFTVLPAEAIGRPSSNNPVADGAVRVRPRSCRVVQPASDAGSCSPCSRTRSPICNTRIHARFVSPVDADPSPSVSSYSALGSSLSASYLVCSDSPERQIASKAPVSNQQRGSSDEVCDEVCYDPDSCRSSVDTPQDHTFRSAKADAAAHVYRVVELGRLRRLVRSLCESVSGSCNRSQEELLGEYDSAVGPARLTRRNRRYLCRNQSETQDHAETLQPQKGNGVGLRRRLSRRLLSQNWGSAANAGWGAGGPTPAAKRRYYRRLRLYRRRKGVAASTRFAGGGGSSPNSVLLMETRRSTQTAALAVACGTSRKLIGLPVSLSNSVKKGSLLLARRMHCTSRKAEAEH